MPSPLPFLPAPPESQEHDPQQNLGGEARELNRERLVREIGLQKARIRAHELVVEERKRNDELRIQEQLVRVATIKGRRIQTRLLEHDETREQALERRDASLAHRSSVANNINNTYIGNMNLSKYYCIVKWCVLYYPI
jgi:hypothetical protein